MRNDIRMIMHSGSILGYFLQVVPITCTVGILYSVFRLLKLKRKNCKIHWPSEMIMLLFVCYITGLFNLIVMPVNFWLLILGGFFPGWWEDLLSVFRFGNFNLTPFFVKYFNGDMEMGRWVKEMLIGNIAMFIPLGLFIPFITSRINTKNIFAFSVLIPLMMESLQLVFGRSFDIDDLICNSVGIMAGFFIAVGIRKVLKNSNSKCKVFS